MSIPLVLPTAAEIRRLRLKELRRLYAQALQVQNACNLSGVLHGAFEAACSLRHCGSDGGLGNLEVSRHPIMLLWASKIADLVGGLDHWFPQEAEALVRVFLQAYDIDGRPTALHPALKGA